MDTLKILLQHLLPQHLLSGWMHRLTQITTPWLKNWQIRLVVRRFDVDMADALEPDLEAYPTFNRFFTRALRPDARPIAGEGLLCSPADGRISAVGRAAADRLIQAKGMDYCVRGLLGGSAELAEPFIGGRYLSVYLSPRDYHRVHMPLAGTLRRMIYVPGSLYSVNALTTSRIQSLFTRNERVVCLFDTAHGPMAVVLVGAIFVGSMATAWAGQITPPYRSRVDDIEYPRDGGVVHLEKGAEMGRFNMGSTVIVLLPDNGWDWLPGIAADRPVRVGEPLMRMSLGTDD